MFNDRDLAVLGTGSALAVLTLLLPLPFAGRIAAGFFVLIAGLSLAFVRLGPDRLPLETWLKRRFLFLIRPRRWSFYVEHRRAERRTSDKRAAEADAPHYSVPAEGRVSGRSGGTQAAERAAGVFLCMLGVCFLYALWAGEAAEIGSFLRSTLP